MKKVVVLSGAGISAESGLKTFRDADGLWEGHDVTQVASPEGFRRNPELVLDFYNQRRRQLTEVEPNQGHHTLFELERHFDVTIITQNVDDLHERAGSTHVVHLHGELKKARSVIDTRTIYDIDGDIHWGDLAPDGHQLRPHIVWFGEMVPMIEPSMHIVKEADAVIVVGTSMMVYPAASLVGFAPEHSTIYYVDPKPNISYELANLKNLEVIPQKATTGLPLVLDRLKEVLG